MTKQGNEPGNEQEQRSTPAATRRLERKTGRRPVVRQVSAAVAGGAVLGTTYVAPNVLSVGVQEVAAASAAPPPPPPDGGGEAGTTLIVCSVAAGGCRTAGGQQRVSGEVEVSNPGDRATLGLAITVRLLSKSGGGGFSPVAGISTSTRRANPVLSPGETGTYAYLLPLFTPVAGTQYKVEALVTILNHSGYLGTPFGPSPDTGYQVSSVLCA
jgi:hypothetical protein